MAPHTDPYFKIPIKKINSAKSMGFEVHWLGELFKGFVVEKSGSYYAYQNVCRHLPVTLDLNDGEFFTHDKTALQCSMHGAIYEIETGLCTGGPCVGKKLFPLEVRVEADQILVKLPAAS